MRNRSPHQAVFAICASLCLFVGTLVAQVEDPQLTVVSGHYSGTDFDSVTFINDTVGARIFYNAGYFGESEIIANIEGGYVWDGHEVFDRTVFTGSTAFIESTTNAVTQFISDPSITGEYDFHATMVGHVLVGAGHVTGTDGVTDLSILGAGMAPAAQLWSGAIATSFSNSDIGSFDTTTASTLTPYRTAFRGISGTKADVINSSWGGSDPAATSTEILTIDALARQNSTVAFVVAAGNSGTGTVSAPGSGYNGITVGSLGGSNFLTSSTFTSSGPTDFYNPATAQTIVGVRHSVDISAPGEQYALAAYLGSTGSLQGQPITKDTLGQPYTSDNAPTDQYFLNEDGTSFATPIVAGGIGLLKDAAKGPFYALGPLAFDTRVIKSVLMAGSQRTVGWNNGQVTDTNGVIRTTQALDYAAGAGALDLTGAAEVYLLAGTKDVAGLGGGSISSAGWDYGSVAYDRTSGIGQSNDYTFDSPFANNIELTISLNWFAGRTFDENDLGADLSFADLNLQLWLVVDGVFVSEVAESATIYDNTEFLRVDLDEAGTYGLRVTFNGLVYDLSPETIANEDYGLAWQSQAVPEPGTIALLGLALALLFFRKRIRDPVDPAPIGQG